jgi:hypothetical protein
MFAANVLCQEIMIVIDLLHTGNSGHSAADKNPVFIFIRTVTRKIQNSIIRAASISEILVDRKV